MRIVHKSDQIKLSTNRESFSCISKIIRLANKEFGSKMVFDLKKTKKADGNLKSVYAALDYNLRKSRNTLRILPKKSKALNVELKKDMFGYYTQWEHEIEATFCSGGTKVYAFDPFDYWKFNEYLLFEAFRADWKRIIPCYYKTEIKDFLRNLFRNASEHSNSHSPIFIASAYDGEMLRFTIIDCGQGFLKSIDSTGQCAVNESEAIGLALLGYTSKDTDGSNTLRLLGQYCSENNGDLLVVSGGSSVSFDKNGFHNSAWLPGAFRGSIINFSVKIKLPEFLSFAA